MQLPGNIKIDYKRYLRKVSAVASRFQVLLVSVVILGLFSVSILRIGTLAESPINNQRVEERANEIKKINFNEDAITLIQSLEGTNIDIGSIFDDDRQNPFAE